MTDKRPLREGTPDVPAISVAMETKELLRHRTADRLSG